MSANAVAIKAPKDIRTMISEIELAYNRCQRWMRKFNLPLGRHVQLYGLNPHVQH